MFTIKTELTGAELQTLVTVLSSGYSVTVAESVGFTSITCDNLVPTAKMTVKQLAVIAASKGIKLPPRSKKAEILTALGVDEMETAPKTAPKATKAKIEEPAEPVDGDHITVPVKQLKSILQEAKKFVPKKYTHPVLQYYKIVVKAGFARIYATDLSQWYENDLPAISCVGDWKSLISPAELESLCKGKGYVYISAGEMWNTAGTKIEYFSKEKVEEYPTAPTAIVDSDVSIVTNEIFKQGGFAYLVRSKDETKQVLTGVNYQIKNGICDIAATDGYRLYTHTVSVPSDANINFTIKADLSQIDWQGDLLISKDEDWLFILDDSGRAVTVRTLDSGYSQYPNYRALSPTTFTGESIIDCKKFTEAIKQLYIAAGKDNTVIQLSFKFASQQLILGISKDPRDHSADMVTAAIDCAVTEDIAFNLDVNYLKDLVKLDSGEIFISKGLYEVNNGNHDPFIVKTGEYGTYLLMGIQLKK